MIDFTEHQIEKLNYILENDVKLLREIGVMDYSLLIIIIKYPLENDPDYKNILSLVEDSRYYKRTFISKNKKYIYVLGIIDYLQKFNLGKFIENKYKHIVYGDEIKYVSAVDPILYSDRLIEFSRNYIFISQP